ncbi:hypothetical protein DFQ04_2764 [Algoriphagus boseongensis]|uniref:Uncharacterized protein n=1 Tax=Algoriphagus boseongensis TaxID=1442587 RepID=A0A4R6T4C6_9BACT|nr:hypothetical protein [Algoriphagus boseongensis]TDQ16642.1 hypothetical protein DFQ04_2764 [Algoriphagus boseongensis]
MSTNFYVELTAAELQTLKDAQASILNVLAPKLKALSPDERRDSVKMGEASIPFVRKIMEYVVSNPEFTPAFVKPEVMEKQWKSIDELTPFFNALEQLVSNLSDSILDMGSQLMKSSNAYYKQTQVAVEMDVPNAKPVNADLKVRYERKPKPAVNGIES